MEPSSINEELFQEIMFEVGEEQESNGYHLTQTEALISLLIKKGILK